MANDIYDWSTTAADNDDADATINWLENQLPGTVNGSARAMMKRVAELLDDLGAAGTVGGTGDAITLTSAIASLGTAKFLRFVAGAANTGPATLAVNGLTAKAVRKISGGTDVALSAGDLAQGETYTVIYRSAANSAAGAWVLVGAAAVAAATTSAAGTVKQNFPVPYNLDIECSVGSSALTIALKGVDGNDPSSSNPVIVPFRNVTVATGAPSFLTVTSATSLVISSGSTLGAPTNSVAFKVWVVAFNDGGTFRLGAILCTTLASGALTMYPLAAYGIASSTAEGGAGGADSAQTFYTGTAVTSKAYTVLAVLHFESGLATAGTWAAAPTRVQIFDASVPLPGRVVNVERNQLNSLVTGATTTPVDDTNPQNTEGNQILTQVITPTSAANLLEIDFLGFGTNSTATAENITTALHQDSVANALAARLVTTAAVNYGVGLGVNHLLIAATTSATTFKIRVGAGGATINVNGIAGGRLYGGAASSTLRVTEIAA